MSRIILNTPVAAATEGIINITRYKDSSRKSVSATSDGRNSLVNTSFTKLKSDAQSYILVTGIIPMRGMPNYPQIGCCCTIDNIAIGYTDTAISGRTGAGGGGFYYCGPDRSYENTLGVVHKSFKEFTLGSGSHTLQIGWYSDTSVRCCEVQNFNSNDNARDHQSATHILIYEISR